MINSYFKHTPGKHKKCDNKMVDVYKAKYNADGERVLEKVETINAYEDIQSYKDEVDIKNLKEMYSGQLQGDMIVDETTKMLDLTNMPKNLMETLNLMNEAEDKWKKLPAKHKELFSNDINKFLAKAANGEMMEMLKKEFEKNNQTSAPTPPAPTQQVTLTQEEYEKLKGGSK